MSPAPQGSLEVERYIGSCLISQSTRPVSSKQFLQNKSKKLPNEGVVRQFVLNPRESPCHAVAPRYPLPPLRGDYYTQHGWTGMPLFCVASHNNQRRHRKAIAVNNKSPRNITDTQNPDSNIRLPLSRLAIHTQGAPLIQAGRYNKIGFNHGPAPSRLYRGGDLIVRRTKSVKDAKVTNKKEASVCDSVSVASDESAANSENSLPRIIKPRKRRKKDRKPQPQQHVKSADPTDDESKHDGKVPVSHSTVSKFIPAVVAKNDMSIRLTVETVFSEEADKSLVSPCGDELSSELDQEDIPDTSVCQCRYCDPAGVIWDVDQRCYSPFLTPPSPTDPGLPFTYKGYSQSPALRRSWSEPSPGIVPQFQPRTRACSESQKESISQPRSLEVSSEIITSPNGHRDIEIKFFSTRPDGASQFNTEEQSFYL